MKGHYNGSSPLMASVLGLIARTSHVSLRCWILGHEDWVRREPDRLYLECFECGRKTPGWSLAKCHQGHNTTAAKSDLGAKAARIGRGASPICDVSRSEAVTASVPDRGDLTSAA